MTIFLNKLFKVSDGSEKDVRNRVLLIIAISHLLAVFFSDGFHRPDEHLGMIRMVAVKLDLINQGLLAWEIPAMIRSWAQPGLYYIIGKLLLFSGFKNPFFMAFIFRLISSILGFLSILCLINILPLFINKVKSLKISYLFFLVPWYLPFFHARTTTENFSITFFIFSFYLIVKYIPSSQLNNSKLLLNQKTKDINVPKSILFLSGLILSFSFF